MYALFVCLPALPFLSSLLSILRFQLACQAKILQTGLGLAYKETYLKPALLAAANEVASAAQKADVDGHAVALRWIVYHSILDGAKGDAVVLGASSVEQLEKNLNSIEDGPLDEALVKLVDRVFESVRGEAADYCL